MPSKKSTSKKPERSARGEGSVYQRKDGVWVATIYMGPGKRPHLIYGKSAEDAENKREQHLEKVARGLTLKGVAPTLASGLRVRTVSDLIDYWLDGHVKPQYDTVKGVRVQSGGLSPRTYDAYEAIINRHVRPHLGRVKLEDLTPDHIDAWTASLRKAGVGLVTRRDARVRLIGCLSFGVRKQSVTHLLTNPAKASTPERQVATEDKAAPDPQFLARLLALVDGHIWGLIVNLAVEVGLRRQEIAALQFGDFDCERGVVLIRRRVQRIKLRENGEGGKVVRGGEKWQGDWHVTELPLSNVEYWRAMLARQRQMVMAFAMKSRRHWKGGEIGSPTAFLFPTRYGGPQETTETSTWLRAQMAAAGNPSKTLHQLRHDFAGILIDQGATLEDVKVLMRHSDISITSRYYAHLTEQRKTKTAALAHSWLQDAMAKEVTAA